LFANSLCHSCLNVRKIENKRGSVFYMCRRNREDPRFMKYPPQPVRFCPGYARATDDKDGGMLG